jgi:hypothetical protein
MKRTIIIILMLISIILVACETATEITSSESKCDSYTTLHIKQKCQAVEAQDISMCEPIENYAFREDCIMIIAQLVQDQSQLDRCELSENKNNKITCQALIKQDVNQCFVMQENLAESSARQMRDCIDLVAIKLKDKSVCKNFVTNSDKLMNACGQTNSCEGEWVESAHYHQEDCEMRIE